MDTLRVPVPTDTRAPGGETNAYVVGRDPALLVDPAGRTDRLDDAVTDRNVAHVAVTHAHPDHVGGVADYAAECEATVWARAGRAERFRAATGVAPDETFHEGTTIATGDGPVAVLDVPGHAPDHVAFHAGEDVLAGDCVVAEGSVVVADPEGDMRGYLTALRRLHAMAPERLLAGHGPEIDDPRATCRRLLAHRLDRERRVERAVGEGARAVDAILDAAYDKDLAGVRDLAAATVRAHLAKLAVEGRIRWDGAHADPP